MDVNSHFPSWNEEKLISLTDQRLSFLIKFGTVQKFQLDIPYLRVGHPAYLVRPIWIVYKMGGRCPYSCSFECATFSIYSKQRVTFLSCSHLALFLPSYGRISTSV